MKFDKVEYIKSEFPGSPDTLVIETDGRVRYESHSNETAPDDPQIGLFQMTVPAARIGSLEELLAAPPFETLPDHWGRLRPGEDARRVRVTAGQEKYEKLVGYREPVDLGMQRLIDAFDELVLEAKSHPYQTLRISLDQVAVESNGVLSAVLWLSNTGVEAMACRSPSSMIGDSDGEISFQVWPDKPRAELLPEDLIVLKPVAIEDVRFTDDAGSAVSFLDLGPGAALSFNVRLAWGRRSAGRYLIRGLYMNPAREMGGQRVFVGELYSQAAAVDSP